jgi:hypothetical protein
MKRIPLVRLNGTTMAQKNTAGAFQAANHTRSFLAGLARSWRADSTETIASYELVEEMLAHLLDPVLHLCLEMCEALQEKNRDALTYGIIALLPFLLERLDHVVPQHIMPFSGVQRVRVLSRDLGSFGRLQSMLDCLLDVYGGVFHSKSTGSPCTDSNNLNRVVIGCEGFIGRESIGGGRLLARTFRGRFGGGAGRGACDIRSFHLVRGAEAKF